MWQPNYKFVSAHACSDQALAEHSDARLLQASAWQLLTCLSRVQILADLLTAAIVGLTLIDVEAGTMVFLVELYAHPAKPHSPAETAGELLRSDISGDVICLSRQSSPCAARRVIRISDGHATSNACSTRTRGPHMGQAQVAEPFLEMQAISQPPFWCPLHMSLGRQSDG